MALGEETAFFHFDTNAGEVASNIAGAMERINASLSKPATTGELAANTAGLGQVFSRAQSDLERAQGQLRALMDPKRWSGGAIDPKQFQSEFQKIVRGAVGGIPQTLADELAHTPTSVATRSPIRHIATQMGQDFVNTLTTQVAAGKGQFGDALKGLRLGAANFKGDVRDLSLDPVAYGNETSRMQELINRIRAENMVRQFPNLAEAGSNAGHDAQRELESRLGIDRLTSDIRRNQVTVKESDAGDSFQFVPSGAPEELRELIKLQRDAESTGNRLERQNEATARSALQLATANEVLAESEKWQRAGSRLVGSDGRVLKSTTVGFTDEMNPWRAEDARATAERHQQEAANAARLAEHSQQVKQVGTFAVLGDEAYMPNREGTSAKRVADGYMLNKILEQRDALLERELLKEMRLNELDGKRVLRQEQGRAGLVGGFMQRFQRGEQTIATGLGGQMASAAAFSFAYGSLFALQNAVSDTVSEFLDYQDSLTDLQVATRSTDVVTGEWVNSLSELSRLSGSNMGAAMDTAARGVRAFADPLNDTKEQVQAVGTATEEAATKLALIANKSLGDATGDVISIGSSFDMEPDQLLQIVDAVASAKRNLGGDPAQIAQGLSLIAGAATEAGYDLDEAASVISLVQARTDQSGQAIATRLQRIFQIVSGSTGKGLARELGVDPNASVKSQIEDYAKIYSNPNTSEGVRDRITSALGGTANLRELLPLLKENDRLMRAYEDALTNAGSGTAEFQNKSDNLVGTLKKLAGDIRNIQVDLAKADLFGPLGAGLKVLEPAVHAIDLLIKGYDRLTGSVPGLQQSLGVLVDIALVSKGIAVLQNHNAGKRIGEAVVEGAADVGIDMTARRAETAAIGVATRERMAAEQVMNGTIVGSARSRGLSEVGGNIGIKGGFMSLLRFMRNPLVLGGGVAVGALAAGEKLWQSRDERQTFLRRAGGVTTAYDRIDGSSESIEDVRRDINAAVGTIKKSGAGLFGTERDNVVADLTGQNRALSVIQRRVTQEERLAARLEDTTVFGNGAIETVSELANGLSVLAASGETGLGQVRTLRRALSTPPSTSGERFRPEALGAEVIGAVMGTLKDSLPGTVEGFRSRPSGQGFWNPLRGGRNPLIANPQDPNGPINPLVRLNKSEAIEQLGLGEDDIARMNKAYRDKARELGLAQKGGVTEEDKAALLEAAISAADMSQLPRDAQGIVDEWVKNSKAALDSKLVGPKGVPKALLNQRGPRTPEQILSILNPSVGDDGAPDGKYPGFLAVAQQGLADIPATDDGRTRLAELRANRNFLRRLVTSGGDNVPQQAVKELKNAEHAFAEFAVERWNDLREGAEAGANTQKELGNIRLRFAKLALADAGTDPNVIEGLMEDLDRQTITKLIAYVRTARKIAQSALEHAQSLIEVSTQVVESGHGIDGDLMHGGNVVAGNPKAVRNRRKKLDELSKQEKILNDLLTGEGGGRAATITELKPPKPPAQEERERKRKEREKDKKDRLTAEQRAAREAQALRDPRDSVGAARDSLRVAQANLATIKDHTSDEYFSALQQVTQAQNALADSLAAKSTAFIQADVARAGGGSMASAMGQIKSARIQLSRALPGTEGEAAALASLYGGIWAKRAAGAQKTQAMAESSAARQNGPVAAARAQLIGARAQLNAQAENTAEWFQALAGLYQAQWAMRESVLQYRNNIDLLRGDSTDPVEQARDALRAAGRKFRSDARNGAGRAVMAEDRVAQQDAGNALRGAKFQQRMSDMQLAEELGRISFSKYMSYLDHEHDRLTRIRHRTRQQQDQLDAVDQAMKSALDSMDSQFNLGDINTNGLVYQMRRFKAEARANASVAQLGNNTQVHQTVTISVDGADTAKVKTIINDYLGVGHGQTRTLTRRKV